MPFVVDASLTMSWCFEDEVDPRAERALDLLRRERAHVPAIWVLEVANVLLVGERRGRLTDAQGTQFLDLLSSLPIEVEPLDRLRTWNSVVALAKRHSLSAYDAAYLELAARLGLSLAAADGKLRAVAPAAGVVLLD